jgi:hypothetical protein
MPVLLVFSLAVVFHKDAIRSIYKNVDDFSDRRDAGHRDFLPVRSGSRQHHRRQRQRFELQPAFGRQCVLRWQRGVNGKRHLVLQTFRQACVFHDLCYRHGLATYGYNQNDCDRVSAERGVPALSLYPHRGAAESCQTDSKMVLAGVSLGGYGAYRAWDKSTYFEFESDPSRSNGFLVSRVVDHPFKSVIPDKYRGDSDQVILTSRTSAPASPSPALPAGGMPILKWTRDPREVTPEFRSVGFTTLPQALLQHQDQMLSETKPVWLPPRRRHAAPHLLIDSTGKNHLIWMSRNNPQDTVACIVVADAARLLTHTLPETGLLRGRRPLKAHHGRNRHVRDLAASDGASGAAPEQDRSMQPASVHKPPTGHSLSLCSRSASRAVN